MQKTRLITLQSDPKDTTEKAGFYHIEMGPEGTWLVDKKHPGYSRIVKKAIKIAEDAGKKNLVEKYKKLPGVKEITIASKVPITSSVASKEEDEE